MRDLSVTPDVPGLGLGGLSPRMPAAGEADLRPLQAALGTVTEGLAASCATLGAELGQTRRRLGRAVDGLGRLGASLRDAETAAAVEGLAAAAGDAMGLAELDRARAAALQELAAATAAGGAAAAEMAGAIGSLRQLDLLARIGAAKLGGRHPEIAALVGDIGRLVVRASTAAAEAGHHFKEVDGSGARVRALEAGLAAGAAGRLGDVAGRLDAVARDLRAYQGRTAAVAAAAGEASDRVNAHIGRIITALQFDDIARQRIEHVGHGLERLAALLERGTLSDEEPPAPPETVRLAAGALAGLMVRQVVDLAGQLEAAAAALARELAATIDQVGRLEPEVDRLAGGDGRQGGDGTPLDRLDRELGGARALFAAYADAHQGVCAELARLGDVAAATAATSRALDQVEIDIRIVGLNAEIKSARLGDEGTATKRIAEAVREHAAVVSQANAAYQDAAGRLDAAARRASGDLLPQHRLTQGRLTGRLEHAATVFGARGQAVAATTRDTREAFDGLADRLLSRRGEVAAWREGATALRETLGGLRAVAARGRDEWEPASWPALDRLMRSLYTMDAERRVHEGRAAEAADAGPPAPSDPDDLSDILFD